jgi:predicted MFS family arabinose efflux permease
VFAISAFWFAMSAAAAFRIRPYPSASRPDRGYDYRGLARQRPLLIALGILTAGFIAVWTGQPLLSQYLEEARHFSRTTIGAFGSVTALGTAVFSLLLGRLAAWRGFFASLTLVSAAFVLLLITGSPPVVMVALFMFGGYYASRPMATSVISPLVSEHQRGTAFALVDTLAGLATLIGANTAGALYAQDPQGPFVAALAGIGGVMLLGMMLLRAPRARDLEAVGAYSEQTSK